MMMLISEKKTNSSHYSIVNKWKRLCSNRHKSKCMYPQADTVNFMP